MTNSVQPAPRRRRRRMGNRVELALAVLLVLAWAVGLGLGYVGHRAYLRDRAIEATSSDVAYLTLKLVNLGSDTLDPRRPLALEVARWVLPMLAALTVMRAFYVVFRDSIRLMLVRRRGGHAVICGLSRKGFLLANSLRLAGWPIVIIDRDAASPLLADCRLQGDLVVIGDATSQAVLDKAAVQKSTWVFAVCDDEGANARIAVEARNVAEARQASEFHCLTHMADPLPCQLLTDQGILDEVGSARARRHTVTPFSVFELGAPILLGRYDPFATAGSKVARPDSAPRLLFVGMGFFGAMVLVEAARRWRALRGASDGRMPVTVVALDARASTELLRIRHPDDMDACQLEALEYDVLGPDYQGGLFLFDADHALRFDQAFVCLDSDSLAVRSALSMQDRIAAGPARMPIIVRLAEDAGLGALLHSAQGRDAQASCLHPFALLTETCTPEVLGLDTAR